MDQKTQEERRNDTPTQTQANGENQNKLNQIVSLSRPLFHTVDASAFSSYMSRAQLQEFSHRQQKQQELQKKLGIFWENKMMKL